MLTGTHATALLTEPLPEVVWMYEWTGPGAGDLPRRWATLAVELPLDRMQDRGVAPASFGPVSSLVPDAHGGTWTPRR